MDSTSPVTLDFEQSGEKNDGGFDLNSPSRCGGTAEDCTNAFSKTTDEAVRRYLSLKIDEIVSGLIQEHRIFLQMGMEKVETLIDDVKEKTAEDSTNLWRRLERCVASHEALATRIDQLCGVVEHQTNATEESLDVVKVFYLKLRGESDLELMLDSTAQDSQRD
jgi:hypothetical protein